MTSSKTRDGFEVYVVVLNWNRAGDTLECLGSMASQQDVTLHIIVVDNGSTDHSVEQIRAIFPAVELISTGANLGFPGGMNIGIRRALQSGAEKVLLLNNDTIADAQMIRNLVDGLKPEYGCAAPAIYYADSPDQLWSTGVNIHLLLLEMWANHPVIPEHPLEKTFFTGCALLVRRSVFYQIGLLDESFFPWYYEDLDFSLRVLRAEIRMVLVPRAKLWHKISQSSDGSNSPRVRFLMARNSAWYFRKHMRWWQVPIIVGHRFMSAVKTSILLITTRDWKGMKAHWIGLIVGWLGWDLVGARAYTRQYEQNSSKIA